MQHDDTVVALLSVLKYYRYPEFPGVQPQYSTSVVLELHEQTPENFVVKIFLRNVTNSTDLHLYPIPIQGKAFDNWLKKLVEKNAGFGWKMIQSIVNEATAYKFFNWKMLFILKGIYNLIMSFTSTLQ